jgi:uncharacterized protein (TIGR00255 family)
MVQSMTGYASCFMEQASYQIDIEAKSVNNRFFSLSYRSAGGLEKYEELIRSTVQKIIGRGSLNIFIKLKSSTITNRPRLDKENIREIVSQMHEIASELGISKQISMETLLRIPGAVADSSSNHDEENEDLKALVVKSLEKVLKDLIVMRENEGQRLIDIINTSLDKIVSIEESLKKEFKGSQKDIADDLMDKINKTVQSLNSEMKFEAKDITKEVVLLIERADIAEEINRINSHIVETKKTMKSDGQIGKKLDFLCQEFSREFNTICSKTKKIEISQLAVSGKLEVEKIREQVQNIE